MIPTDTVDMVYRIIQPALPLRRFIRQYQLCHFVFGKDEDIPQKSYPACPEEGFSFFLRGTLHTECPELSLVEERPRAAIFGLPDCRQNFSIPSDFMLLHVWFHPGALYQLLRIPMAELLCRAVDAELICGQEIRYLYDELANAQDYAQLPDILDRFFLKKCRHIYVENRSIDSIGQLIMQNPAGFNLDHIAGEACLSHRAFERKFMQRIGVTPKYYARLCRFWKAFQQKESQPDLDWLSLAIAHGYTDYQHLAKDFKQFAGVTPINLLQEAARDPERALRISPEIYG